MSYLILDELTKIYDARSGERAVSDLSFEASKGEFVALLGPSGCGKSTTLRMIAGLEDLSSGRILLDGTEIHTVPPDRRHIGLAFETYSLYPPLTVFENIAYNLRAKRVPTKEINHRVTEIARILGIDEILYAKPGKLSGGQKQRVNLARAIVRNPALLLLDEPLSHLDTVERRQLRRELKRIHHETRLTTVLVTHDQSEAMALADRIVVLHDGKLQQNGPVIDVYRVPANLFVAAFIGEPSMNFVDGWQSGTRVDLGDSMALTTNVAHKGDVTIGIRPDDLAFISPGRSAGSDRALRGIVKSIEYLGDETHVVVETVGTTSPSVIRIGGEPQWPLEIGETVVIEVRRFHVFERDTGIRIDTVEDNPSRVSDMAIADKRKGKMREGSDE